MDQTYSIPVESMGTEECEMEKKRLTLQARVSFGQPPPAFPAWFVEGGRFHVPRFYGLERFGPAETDERTDGDPISLRFEGTLTDVQRRATDAVMAKNMRSGTGGAIVHLPCGMGKTVWAVNAIVQLGRKACIFVHKNFLRDQWEETFARFCPGVRIGEIRGKTWRVEDCDVVIAMVMTMAKREYSPDVMDCFGTICFDECHHMAAPVMNMATRACRARHVIGLTATKERPDGLTPLLHWCLGPEGFRAERETEGVRVSIALFPGGTREILTRDGKPVVSVMINKLAANRARNAFIADRLVSYFEAGRVVLLLSDRIAQLRTLREMAIEKGVPEEDVGLFTGETKEADRHVQLQRRVVMCSYGMANEGLDKKEADTCVMATPKARVTQCIGRIQRPCETKMAPLVLDVSDDVTVFVRLRWTRQKLYSKERYDVQVLRSDEEAEKWYC